MMQQEIEVAPKLIKRKKHHRGPSRASDKINKGKFEKRHPANSRCEEDAVAHAKGDKATYHKGIDSILFIIAGDCLQSFFWNEF